MKNKGSLAAISGASNLSNNERQANDFYATPGKATLFLLENHKFNKKILEPCCGQGHISKILLSKGYAVTSSDLINRGYGQSGVDFLQDYVWFQGDIITNPPFSKAIECLEQAFNIIEDGHQVAFFLKTIFLHTLKRGVFLERNPPLKILIFSRRIRCIPGNEIGNKEFKIDGGGMDYSWFIFKKGHLGKTELIFVNK